MFPVHKLLFNQCVKALKSSGQLGNAKQVLSKPYRVLIEEAEDILIDVEWERTVIKLILLNPDCIRYIRDPTPAMYRAATCSMVGLAHRFWDTEAEEDVDVEAEEEADVDVEN